MEWPTPTERQILAVRPARITRRIPTMQPTLMGRALKRKASTPKPKQLNSYTAHGPCPKGKAHSDESRPRGETHSTTRLPSHRRHPGGHAPNKAIALLCSAAESPAARPPGAHLADESHPRGDTYTEAKLISKASCRAKPTGTRAFIKRWVCGRNNPAHPPCDKSSALRASTTKSCTPIRRDLRPRRSGCPRAFHAASS